MLALAFGWLHVYTTCGWTINSAARHLYQHVGTSDGPTGEIPGWCPSPPTIGSKGSPLAMELLMLNHRKSLTRPRTLAYTRQSGRCFYCGTPMWQDNPKQFASNHKLSLKQVKLLKCTGEHLTAHSDGGEASISNIVAACWFWNNRRHKTAKSRTPESYRKHVHKRMAKGHWHQLKIPPIR